MNIVVEVFINNDSQVFVIVSFFERLVVHRIMADTSSSELMYICFVFYVEPHFVFFGTSLNAVNH